MLVEELKMHKINGDSIDQLHPVHDVCAATIREYVGMPQGFST